jgi:hypothetical protein
MKVTKVSSYNGLRWWSIKINRSLSYSTKDAIVTWCTEQFGHMVYKLPNSQRSAWTYFCGANKFEISFMLHDDVTLFLLRWSDGNLHGSRE